MRLLIPLAALLLCGISLAVENLPRTADSAWCQRGLCRFDQMYEAAAAGEISPAQVAALLQQDSNNPDAWCTYAEFQAMRGKNTEAAAAFQQALALAPEIPSVAMRAANFYFTHNRRGDEFQMSTRILALTRAFDEVLFSYARQSGLPVFSNKVHANLPGGQQADQAIPALPRPAKAWLHWMIGQQMPQTEITSVWSWMRARHLADEESAMAIVNEFWRRKDYPSAREVWLEWRAEGRAQRGNSRQLLNNPDFSETPRRVPLDWNLSSSTTVEITRDGDGVDVRFPGSGNIDFRDIYQSAAVTPGRYRLAAEISSEGLTTDQKPFFQILDTESPNRFHVESDPVPATATHAILSLDFTVPGQTRAVNLQLIRLPSTKFDNKIEGHLRLHSIRLTAR